ATGASVNDDFERADGALGSNWVTPATIPNATVAVALAIDAGEVIVTVPDDGTDPHEWGFAQHVTEVTGIAGVVAELDVTNLAQSSVQGPIVRSKAELYTNMNDSTAACQALSVDFDYGITATPIPPVIVQEPFETLDRWEIVGSGAGLTPDGRNGQCLQVSGTTSYLSYNLPDGVTPATVIVGIGFKIPVSTGVTAINSVRNLLEVRGDDGTVLHGKVAVDIGGLLYATDANGVNKGGSPLGSILPNTWYYAEVRYVLHNTAGEFSLRLDGVDVAGAYDIDTLAGSGTVDQIRIPSPGGGNVFLDDFYLATGDTATFIGPLDVANGSLAWELHQYDASGASVNTVGSGAIPYDYDAATPARLRLESAVSGAQRFLLDGKPIVEVVDESPVVGTLVGFGASYETFEYPVETGDFLDDFERATLGSEWVLPVARAPGRVVQLPTISTGAAVFSGHPGAFPQQYSSVTTTGATLTGGVLQTMPNSLAAGHLCIARVLQENPGGVPITASTGWTLLGAASQGTPGGDFMETFDNFGAWTTAGSAATIVATGRSTNAARITGVNTSNHVDYRLPADSDTIVVGFAHQVNSLAGVAEVCQFYSDSNATQHNRLTINTNGSLSFWRGVTGLGTTAAGIITTNTWNYIEVRAKLSDTAGEVIVRVNGVERLNLTAQDTQNAGTKTVYDTFRLTGPIASFYNTFDDLYLVTGAAATFKGDQSIAASSGNEFIRMACFARLCDGTSNDALTVTGAPTGFVSAIESYYMTGSVAFPTNIVSQIVSASATGSTGFPDPPPITLPATKDWMFISSAGVDCQSAPTMAGSANYSSIHGTITSTTGFCAMRSGSRLGTQSGVENPAAYTNPPYRPWIAFTIAFPGGDIKWAAAENAIHDYDPTQPIIVEALVNSTALGGPPMVELYSYMTVGSPACRVLQLDCGPSRFWKMGHYVVGSEDIVVAATGVWAATAPWTFRFESDPDGTERFLLNGTLVQEVVDATAPTPTGAARVGFGEFSHSSYTPTALQVRSFSASGGRYLTGPPPPEPSSPRIERFAGTPLLGTSWAIPGRVVINYDPTKPRPDAPTITGPPEFAAGVEDSPHGNALVSFDSSGKGLAIYDDGFVYDGKGWRKANGDAADWNGDQLGPSTTDPQKPRHDAPSRMEDQIPLLSPKGSPLKDYIGFEGLGLAIYNDGYVFDGRGWRNSVGQATYDDGIIVTKAPIDIYPPNNPPPGGKPPWAWTPPVDPLTGEPSILTVHFCFYDQWI
ncbi:MAG TPA: hypothetical protein VFP09_03625, partial [Desertimonas sp.]|nr:hypothetical protein [Desertimonas sp.]